MWRIKNELIKYGKAMTLMSLVNKMFEEKQIPNV